MSGVRRGLGLVVLVVCVAMAARVAWVGYGPRDETGLVRQQVRFLDGSLAAGGASRMQDLFPEGSYFLRALTASAAARTPGTDLNDVRSLRDSLDAPDSVAVFGSGMVPAHGIFQAGWALMVADDLAAVSGESADLADVRRRAVVIEKALRGSRTGFLEGYPQQYWPCDTVVAAASLARAAVLLDQPGWLDTVRRWRTRTAAFVDPRTGLLPHRVAADGRAEEGPRGSSQSIIQAFWPTIALALDGSPDRATWARFREAFVVREAGLIGVREFPRGADGSADVDSGPLIFGVSASASAVTLAAARAAGDEHLADDLSREAVLLGLPLAWGGARRYGFGLLPVGDAFVAWARSVPMSPPIGPSAAETILGRPRWPVFIGVGLVPVALIVLVFGLRSSRTRLRPRVPVGAR